MNGRRDTPVRGSAVRPLLAAVEIVALGAAAHVAVGGVTPSADALGVSALLAGAVCWALHERLLRVWSAALVAVGAQVAVHAIVAATASPHAAHVDHVPVVATSGTQMLVAHLVSAVVTVLVLVWQERALLVVVRALTPREAAPPVPRSASLRPGSEHGHRRDRRRTLDVAPRRGPPLTRAVALVRP